MVTYKHDGRMFQPKLTAMAQHNEDGLIELRAPQVGLWRGAPAPGSLVTPGMTIGELEVLGVLHQLCAPADAAGLVEAQPQRSRLARQPVGYADLLLRLDPQATAATAGLVGATTRSASTTQGLVFRSPLSGRYYARPSPDKPAFVKVGDVIDVGQTVALLEVMKTFNRVAYGGDELPARAKIVAIRPQDEADVEQGDVMLEVEPA